jgi:alanyl-tRNA synthetase
MEEYLNEYLGVLAYHLWATYGLPLEVTKDICKENGLEVDEEWYYKAKEGHKKKSGKSNDRIFR